MERDKRQHKPPASSGRPRGGNATASRPDGEVRRKRPAQAQSQRRSPSQPQRSAEARPAPRPEAARPRDPAARSSTSQREAARSTTQRQRAAGKPAAARKRKPRKAKRKIAFGKMFGHNFAVRMATTGAVVVALLLCFLIFFRVQTVSVVGNSIYTQEEIQEASGIGQNSALLLINKTSVASRIIAELPYINEVRIGISLPDTVKLEVVELQNAYAVAADDGSYWLINGDGRLVEQITAKEAGDYLQIDGVRIRSTAVGQTMEVLEEAVPEPETEGEEQTESEDTEETDDAPEASAHKRMEIALELLGYLENTKDIRSVTSLDVSSIYDLQLWYGTQYQVKLGTNTQLEYKIEYMVAAIAKLDSYQSGVLDLTLEEAKTARFIPWNQ